MNKNHNNEPLMSIGLILPEDNQNNVSITLFGEKFSLLIDGIQLFEFKNDLTEIDFNKEVIALWFFKERSDRNSQPFIDLAGKLIPYYPNAFLLTTCKKIKIKEAKKTYIRRPVVQLDLSSKKYYEIIERFK